MAAPAAGRDGSAAVGSAAGAPAVSSRTVERGHGRGAARPRCGVTIALLVALLSAPAASHARSLASQLHSFIEQNTSIFTVGGIADFVTPAIQQLAVRGVDFPPTSTAPGFTYRFNVETGTFERSPASLGPVFVERPETIGRGRIDLSLSALYGNLDEVDGGGFGTVSTGQFPVLSGTGPLDVSTALTFEDFSLRTSVFYLSTTYGVSDRWDVNALLPAVHTALHVKARRNGVARDTQGNVVARDEGVVNLDADATGVGDLLLRTKYQLVTSWVLNLALGLVLRLPTGSEGDFQSLGDTVVTPLLLASRGWGRAHFHGALGVDFNVDDSERDRARYAAGVSFLVREGFGLFADVLGTSAFEDDEFTLTTLFPGFLPPPRGVGIAASRRNGPQTTIVAFVPRSDVVDAALGIKLEVFRSAVAFAGALVPLTSDGLRADVVPAAGIEMSF